MRQASGRYKDVQLVGGSRKTVAVFRAIVSGEYNEQPVAVKVESTANRWQLLEWEARVLQYLIDVPGIQKVLWSGREHETFNVTHFSLLGPSLEDKRSKDNDFSNETILDLTNQLIPSFACMHNKTWLHGDVKPGHLLMGTGNTQKTVYVVGFHRSRRWTRGLYDKRHEGFKENINMWAHPVYASINNHLGYQPARRDDMVSLFYSMIDLLKPLPWRGLSGFERSTRIMELKKSTSPEVLCEGLPDAFTCALNHSLRLQFEDQPDYEYLQGLFQESLRGIQENPTSPC